MSISTVNSNDSSTTGTNRSLQMALAAARTAAENRGRNILVLDMRALTPIFDYFVVATGTSRRQLHAMSEEIDHLLEVDLNDKRLGIEGYRESRWIVLDYGNIVVHLFDEETRGYYALEELWGDAVRVPLPELNDIPELNEYPGSQSQVGMNGHAMNGHTPSSNSLNGTAYHELPAVDDEADDDAADGEVAGASDESALSDSDPSDASALD